MIRVRGSSDGGMHVSVGDSATRLTIGAALVALGVLLALNALGVMHLAWNVALGRYWPALLVLWGLLKTVGDLIDARGRRRVPWWPLLVAAVGAFLLAQSIHLLSATAGLIWALAFAALAVYVGLEILFGGRGAFSIGDTHYGVHGARTRKVRLGGDELLIGSKHVGADDAWELEDRVYRHGLGDFQLDLSHARLREGETRLAIFGGVGEIQVLVPESVPVDIEGQVSVGEVRIFGRESSGLERSLSYRSDGYAEAPRRLHIEMVMRMGDITVERVQ